MTPDAFVERLGREGASAILRTDNQEKAALAMEAAIRGGFSIVEFTLTVPGVYEVVQDFSRRESACRDERVGPLGETGGNRPYHRSRSGPACPDLDAGSGGPGRALHHGSVGGE